MSVLSGAELAKLGTPINPQPLLTVHSANLSTERCHSISNTIYISRVSNIFLIFFAEVEKLLELCPCNRLLHVFSFFLDKAPVSIESKWVWLGSLPSAFITRMYFWEEKGELEKTSSSGGSGTMKGAGARMSGLRAGELGRRDKSKLKFRN